MTGPCKAPQHTASRIALRKNKAEIRPCCEQKNIRKAQLSRRSFYVFFFSVQDAHPLWYAGVEIVEVVTLALDPVRRRGLAFVDIACSGTCASKFTSEECKEAG